MRDLELGRVVRALRRRRGWRQQDCAARARVHRSTWSNLERGLIDRMSLGTLRVCLAVLEVRLELAPRWRGSDVDRLLDEGHAALQAAWKERLTLWGWHAQAEVSFNRYGDRGRVDLLAWHPPSRILLVVEIKTEIIDVQAMLGALDVKVRIAPFLVTQLGCPTPTVVIPALVVREGSTNRGRIARLRSLFSDFDLRGRGAVGWLRRPHQAPHQAPRQAPQQAPRQAPRGLLIFSDLRPAHTSRVTAVGSHRVRAKADFMSVDGPPRDGAAPARDA
jgi:transcriptional regulator with XRE-family HTH domain